jgi:hypothetical protein
VTVFLLEFIGSYSVFSSEKVDATQTRRIFRREFAYLTAGNFGGWSSEMTWLMSAACDGEWRG